MAKTGFIIHNGIKQVFTTGPSSGNPVVNGYSINGVLQGPTVNYNQSFVEGSVESIYAGGALWVRKYEDQVNCPVDNCAQPDFSSKILPNCSTKVFTLRNINYTVAPGVPSILNSYVDIPLVVSID